MKRRDLLGMGLAGLLALCGYPAEAKAPQRSRLMSLLETAHDNKYDNTDTFAQGLESLADCTYELIIEAKYDVVEQVRSQGKVLEEKKYEHTMYGSGSCVLMKKKGDELYFATNHHATVAPESYSQVQLDLVNKGVRVKTGKLKAVDVYLLVHEIDTCSMTGGLFPTTQIKEKVRVMCTDEDNDLAVVTAKLDRKMMSLNKWKEVEYIGDDSELRKGNVLYVAGFPRAVSRQLTQGIMTSEGNEYRMWDDHLFYTSAPINPGNSGGACFALRDGKPELVGMPVHKHKDSDGMGACIRVNYLKQFLDKNKLSWLYKRGENGKS